MRPQLSLLLLALLERSTRAAASRHAKAAALQPQSEDQTSTVQTTVHDRHLQQWLCGHGKNSTPPAGGPISIKTLKAVLDDDCGFSFGTKNASARDYRFAEIKTHKTASSSLEVLLASVAAHHKQRYIGCKYSVGEHWSNLVGCVDKFRSSGPPRFDYAMRHVFRQDEWLRNSSAADVGCDRGDGNWFTQAVDSYRAAIGNDVPIIVPVRSAAAHMASTQAYWKITSEMVAADPGTYYNPACKDLRLLSQEHVRDFTHTWLSEGVKLLPVLQDRYNESLVVIRRLLGWTVRDILHGPPDVHKGDAHDGVDGKAGELFEFLQQLRTPPPEESYALDEQLYAGFEATFERALEAVRDGSFEREVRAIGRLSDALGEACGDGRKPISHNFCRYRLADESDVEAMALDSCSRQTNA